MANTQQNWDDLGKNIEDVIDRAINSHNYGQLSENVTEVIQKALDKSSEALHQAKMYNYNRNKGKVVYTYRDEDISPLPNDPPHKVSQAESDYGQYVHLNMNSTRTSSYVYNNMKQPAPPGAHMSSYTPVQQDDGTQTIKAFPSLYRSTGGMTAAGILEIIGGSLISATSASNLIYRSIFHLVSHTSMLSFRTFFMGTLLTGGIVALVQGIHSLHLIDRYKTYVKTLGKNTHCTIEKLSESVLQTNRFVIRDLKKLIRRGYFLQGHLDSEETSLITSNETYHYYQQSKLQLMERQRQEKAEAEKLTAMDPIDPKVKDVLDRGEAFILEIHRCNDRIPGHEISQKIDRIENIVRKIFDRAKEHPEVIPDLKKLMDYYLPMTIKLLNAYAEMDSQPIQGETIAASKKEIENTLDTLSSAFEKLLDFIFKDTALDISSDITVLKTLLAQEGLTEDEINSSSKQ